MLTLWLQFQVDLRGVAAAFVAPLWSGLFRLITGSCFFLTGPCRHTSVRTRRYGHPLLPVLVRYKATTTAFTSERASGRDKSPRSPHGSSHGERSTRRGMSTG